MDLETLIKFGVVDKTDAIRYGEKILGDGQLTTPLEIKLPMSKSAQQKVERLKVKKSN